MTGMTDYSAKNWLNYITGVVPTPTMPAGFLALFTAVGTDAGTGFTEVSGGAYARVQCAGSVAATAAFTTASPNITMTTNPGWVVAGMNVYDTTNGQQIGTVSTYVGTALVLTANAAHASSGTTDSLAFSFATAATGSGPSTTQNNAVVTFPQATANWGTVIAFGVYDAATSGNLLFWDFLGNFQWFPYSVSAVGTGNGAVFTSHGQSFNNADPIVATIEYGGSFPTVTQGTLTGYQINFAAVVTTDTLTLSGVATGQSSANAVWTSTTGDLMLRKITQQSIPINVTAAFQSAALSLTAA